MILEIFKKHIPEQTDYSFDKRLRWSGPKKTALRYPYIRVNSPDTVSMLVFDLDRDFFTLGELEPTFLVINPVNRHSHAFYLLKKPVVLSYRKAWDFMHFVGRLYRAELFADRVIAHQRLLVKNPLHQRWIYKPLTERIYSLSELYEASSRELIDIARNTSTFSSNSRNCVLFDMLRKMDLGPDDLYRKALELNPVISAQLGKPPLDEREVRSIVTSIVNYRKKINNNI